jgi:hypothetical protein
MSQPAGAGILRLQKLTLRIAQPSTSEGSMLQSFSRRASGQVVNLPPILAAARSRRPSALALQMGLVPGPVKEPSPYSQVCAVCKWSTCMIMSAGS